jgi:PAS domain S-box-containing protein
MGLGKTMSVLIVDDNRDSLYLLEKLLGHNGFEVVAASNGVEALSRLRDGKFELVISDIMMPQMDGFQLCIEVKSDSKLSGIPFVFYTATYVEEKDEDLAYMLGADQYIRKPQEPESLIGTVRDILERAENGALASRSRPELAPATFKLYGQRLTVKLDKKIAQLEREIMDRQKVERQLLESGEKYRSLVETSSAGIALLDLQGKITFVNETICIMLGYTESELLGKRFLDFTHEDDRPYILERYNNAIKGIVSEANMEFRVKCREGSFIWLYTNPTRIVIGGRHIGFNAVLQDISVLKDAQQKLETTMQQLNKSLDGAIRAMAKIVEMKDPFTAGHQLRVAELCEAIAAEMGAAEEKLQQMQIIASIHDIGKIYVPSDMLSKPGKLSEIEMQIVKTHPQGSFDILKNIEFPFEVADIVLQHHERLDGTGYPYGLKDGAILPEARLLMVADVVEAMLSHRPYRPAFNKQKALEEIKRNRGTKYDAAVVDACLKIFEEGFEFSVPQA